MRLTNIPTMKIYTRTGDKGETSLVSGERVLKSSAFMDCCGEVDELNSYVGLVVTALSTLESEHQVPATRVATTTPTNESPWKDILREELQEIQRLLFCIGSHLACLAGKREKLRLPEIQAQSTRNLELSIDRMQEQLEPLKNFILPGGGSLGAYLHFCRSLSRRLERTVIRHLSSLTSAKKSEGEGKKGKEKKKEEEEEEEKGKQGEQREHGKQGEQGEQGEHEKEIDPNILIYLNRLSDYFFVAARFCNKKQGKKELKWKTKP